MTAIAEKPTLNGRPRLTLPGFKVASPARQAVPAQVAPCKPPRDVKPMLSKTFHARKLAELAAILGTTSDALPGILCGRAPAPLKVGIRADLAARYPNADAVAIGRWLGQWTGTEQYLKRIAAGGWRLDIDGCKAGEITPRVAAQAIARGAR